MPDPAPNPKAGPSHAKLQAPAFAAGTSDAASARQAQIRVAKRQDAMPCDRCGAEMFRMHAVWRCPRCGFKTDCCGW